MRFTPISIASSTGPPAWGSPIRRSLPSGSLRSHISPRDSIRSHSLGAAWRDCSSCWPSACRATCPNLRYRTVAWWSLLLLTPMALLDPVRETILLGQVNILLAAAVIADMTLIRPERRGVLVGLAAAIKITPVILIPYLVLTRQAGAWRRATGAFIAAAGMGAVASPQASWTYWSHDVWNPGRAGGLAWVGNQGAVAVVERLLHHPLNQRDDVRHHRSGRRCRTLDRGQGPSTILAGAGIPRHGGHRIAGVSDLMVTSLHMDRAVDRVACPGGRSPSSWSTVGRCRGSRFLGRPLLVGTSRLRGEVCRPRGLHSSI